MRNTIILILFSSFVFSCSPYKKVTLKTETFMSRGKVQKFEMNIPKGYRTSDSDLSQYLLKMFVYPDSAVLYISLDIHYQHSLNKENWIKCSDALSGTKCEEGLQDNDKYWKEVMSKNLVVGYYNVSKTQKEEFDKALNSIRLITE